LVFFTVLALTCLVTSHGLAPLDQQNQTQPDELSLERYQTLIQRYREEDFKWTVDELGAVSVSTIEYLSEQLPRLTKEQNQLSPELALSDTDLQAAVLLHTQVAIWKSNERDTEMLEVHWAAAQNICDHVGDPRFRRNWLIARGYFYQTRLEEKPAVAVLEAALREFPEDAEILFALGTVYESLGEFLGRRSFEPLPTPPLSTDQEHAFRKRRFFESGSRKRLERAEKYYKRALESRADFVDAHLRLGRVQYQLGKNDDALRNLGWVIEKATESQPVCLAHLFAGRLCERGDRMEGALEHYRAAVEARADWQLAYMALSNSLHRAGDLEASREVLKQALQLPVDPRNPKGGLWDYNVMNDRFVDLIVELRSGVVY
jgi:tetratricopeptide (TPR) repeat protein